jgi:hypothetical protein
LSTRQWLLAGRASRYEIVAQQEWFATSFAENDEIVVWQARPAPRCVRTPGTCASRRGMIST